MKDGKANRKLKMIGGQMVEYEILPLVEKFDPILHEPTEEIDFDKDPGEWITFIAMSLMQSLDHHQGLGLSANQVGINKRICAINMIGEGRIWGMINPKITWKSETLSDYKEGCLSYPGLFLKIRRPDKIKVEFFAVSGQKLEHEFDGLTATVIQHELDHLDGKVFTDLVPKAKLTIAQGKVKQNLKKMKRMAVRT